MISVDQELSDLYLSITHRYLEISTTAFGSQISSSFLGFSNARSLSTEDVFRFRAVGLEALQLICKSPAFGKSDAAWEITGTRYLVLGALTNIYWATSTSRSTTADEQHRKLATIERKLRRASGSRARSLRSGHGVNLSHASNGPQEAVDDDDSNADDGGDRNGLSALNILVSIYQTPSSRHVFEATKEILRLVTSRKVPVDGSWAGDLVVTLADFTGARFSHTILLACIESFRLYARSRDIAGGTSPGGSVGDTRLSTGSRSSTKAPPDAEKNSACIILKVIVKLLSSDTSMIGVSALDVLDFFIKQLIHLFAGPLGQIDANDWYYVLSHKPCQADSLLEGKLSLPYQQMQLLYRCIEALAAHTFYPDQITDMLIFLFEHCAASASQDSSLNANESPRFAALRRLVLIEATSCTLAAHVPAAGRSTDGRIGAGVDQNEGSKSASDRAPDPRNLVLKQVSLHAWRRGFHLIVDESPAVRAKFLDLLTHHSLPNQLEQLLRTAKISDVEDAIQNLLSWVYYYLRRSATHSLSVSSSSPATYAEGDNDTQQGARSSSGPNSSLSVLSLVPYASDIAGLHGVLDALSRSGPGPNRVEGVASSPSETTEQLQTMVSSKAMAMVFKAQSDILEQSVTGGGGDLEKKSSRHQNAQAKIPMFIDEFVGRRVALAFQRFRVRRQYDEPGMDETSATLVPLTEVKPDALRLTSSHYARGRFIEAVSFHSNYPEDMREYLLVSFLPGTGESVAIYDNVSHASSNISIFTDRHARDPNDKGATDSVYDGSVAPTADDRSGILRRRMSNATLTSISRARSRPGSIAAVPYSNSRDANLRVEALKSVLSRPHGTSVRSVPVHRSVSAAGPNGSSAKPKSPAQSPQASNEVKEDHHDTRSLRSMLTAASARPTLTAAELSDSVQSLLADATDRPSKKGSTFRSTVPQNGPLASATFKAGLDVHVPPYA